jgi:hypothetical protein
MALRSRKRQQITGVLLAIVVLATRIPFIDKMLFEFDSIDFAVALVRFDLSQVTPHMPGYIIHILFGRLIYALLNNPHRAFLAVSILLSIGSVLALWRAAYHLRGERVALITALLWISAPMFWFYGEVETVYPHEAFFASVILWLGISLYRNRESAWRVIGLFVALSLATGARQSSLLFFVPAVIYIMIVSKQSARVWMLAVASFTVVTTGWTLELFHEAGGFAAYLKFAQAEHIYRSQSVLFGNPIGEHVAVMGKVALYLIAGGFSCWIVAAIALVGFRKRCLAFTRTALSSQTFRFVVLVAQVPLLFYVLIYFMKAGYLLNVLPSVFLCGGVLVDQIAIWLAQNAKQKLADRYILTRPLITRRAIILTSMLVVLQVCWFVVPLPGKEEERFRDAASQDSFSASVAKRYTNKGERTLAILNRVFAYTSTAGVTCNDATNEKIFGALIHEWYQSPKPVTVLDTWWSRYAYVYMPFQQTYDIRTYPNARLAVGVEKDYLRHNVQDSVILLAHDSRTLILIRGDHPNLPQLATQVHLRPINMPKYLELYEIMDSTFSMEWNGVRFLKQ